MTRIKKRQLPQLHLIEFAMPHNAHLRGKMQLAKISERSEQKANCILSLLKFLLCVFCDPLA
jgi:hypothetical protein